MSTDTVTPKGLNLESFATDESKEIGGVYFPVAQGVEFLIARWQNTEYLKAAVKFYRDNKVAIERSLMDDGEADDEMCLILAKTIWKGWKGELRLGGEVLQDTPENRVKALKGFKEIRRFVVECSQEAEAYRLEAQADLGKSSAPDSDGSSATAPESSSTES